MFPPLESYNKLLPKFNIQCLKFEVQRSMFEVHNRLDRPGEIANLKAFHPVRFRYRAGPVHCVTGQALYTLATGQASYAFATGQASYAFATGQASYAFATGQAGQV